MELQEQETVISPVLQVEHLVKSYGTTMALNKVCITLPRGEIVGLLGPNGSGKTTFIKILAGLLVPDAGSVLVDGHPIGVESKAVVSYLPERNSLPEFMTVSELVDYFADFFADFDRGLAQKRLQDLHLDLNSRLKALSKGNKEKVQLVLVMSRRAKLYLLDEPIGGVDPVTRDYILETILQCRDPESTVLISTHLIYDIEEALDKFLFIRQGQFCRYGDAHTVEENTGKTLLDLFREDFRC